MPATTARGGPRTTALLVLLWVGWVLVPLGLAVAAMATLLTFFGELPTPEERATADRLLVAAVLTAIAVPMIGLLAAAWTGRRTSAVAFAVALSLGLLAAVPVLHSVVPDRLPASTGGGGCQERSGGDTRCPGG